MSYALEVNSLSLLALENCNGLYFQPLQMAGRLLAGKVEPRVSRET